MGIQVAGGFHIIDHDPRSCTVVHYEQYRLPLRSRPLARAWRIYVTRSMTAELQRVALLAAPELHQLDPWHQAALTLNHAG
jgi:hypothetical protein